MIAETVTTATEVTANQPSPIMSLFGITIAGHFTGIGFNSLFPKSDGYLYHISSSTFTFNSRFTSSPSSNRRAQKEEYYLSRCPLPSYASTDFASCGTARV
jgi:hypothetical protein